MGASHRAIKRSAARAQAFRTAAARSGVKVEAQFWTTGAYDGVLILSGDERKILRCLSRLMAQGNVRTETLRAYSEDEYRKIIGDL